MEIASSIKATEAELRGMGIDLDTLTKDLTLPNPEYQNMVRFGKGRFYKKVSPTICYLKKYGEQYIVPRYYRPISGAYGVSGRSFDASFTKRLRDYQESFWAKNPDALEKNTGLLLEAGCGSGKTVMAIWIAIFRGKQTLVLVPTYYLAKQWKQRIEEFTTASSVIITAKDSEIPTDADFTIVVMDLFTCRVLPKELVNNIGHVILDEAHRVGAEAYLPILEEIPAMYRTALTATFRRTDNVHKILAYHFGTHLVMESRFPRPLVYAVKTGVSIKGVISKNKKYENFLQFLENHKVTYHETKNCIEFNPEKKLRDFAEDDYAKGLINKTILKEILSCISRGEDLSYPVIDSYLNDHSGRRKVAVKLIKECLEAGRTVLFLSKRKDVLKAMNKYFAEYNPMLIVSETRERSDEEETYLQNDCQLILGVTQLAKEGLDIDRLDTLIIHLPMKDTEQAIGRISRLHPSKKQPLALYLLDDCPITWAVYNNAKKFIKINADFKGERTLQTIKTVL